MLRRGFHSSLPGDERAPEVTAERCTLWSSTHLLRAPAVRLATTIAKTPGMYGKAVKGRHCPATVCAFAAVPSFSREGASGA